MESSKNDSFLIGQGDDVSMHIWHWDKPHWDYLYRRHDSVFRDILFPMVIDLSIIHPKTRLRTSMLSYTKHDQAKAPRMLYSQLLYPDYLEYEAVIYFAALWCRRRDIVCELEGTNLRVYHEPATV